MRLLQTVVLLPILFLGCCMVQEPQIIKTDTVNVVEQILKTSCKLSWCNSKKNVYNGSATCIGKQGNTYYLITAKHVAKPQLNNVTQATLTGKFPTYRLYATVWEYDKRGYETKSDTVQAKVIWTSATEDLALVTITARNIKLNVAPLITIQEYLDIKVGDKVLKAGCTSGCAPLFIHGYLSRFSVRITNHNAVVDIYALHTYYGDSGSCLFLVEKNKVVAVTCFGKEDSGSYFCGAIPIVNIFEELSNTKYKFLVPTGNGGHK